MDVSTVAGDHGIGIKLNIVLFQLGIYRFHWKIQSLCHPVNHGLLIHEKTVDDTPFRCGVVHLAKFINALYCGIEVRDDNMVFLSQLGIRFLDRCPVSRNGCYRRGEGFQLIFIAIQYCGDIPSAGCDFGKSSVSSANLKDRGTSFQRKQFLHGIRQDLIDLSVSAMVSVLFRFPFNVVFHNATSRMRFLFILSWMSK